MINKELFLKKLRKKKTEMSLVISSLGDEMKTEIKSTLSHTVLESSLRNGFENSDFLALLPVETTAGLLAAGLFTNDAVADIGASEVFQIIANIIQNNNNIKLIITSMAIVIPYESPSHLMPELFFGQLALHANVAFARVVESATVAANHKTVKENRDQFNTFSSLITSSKAKAMPKINITQASAKRYPVLL